MIQKPALYSAIAVMVLCGIFCISISSPASAQENYRVTAMPAYLILNTDEVTLANNDGNQAWKYGIGLSNRRMINEVPVDFSTDVSFGQTQFIEGQSFFGNNSIVLRYQSVVLSALRIFELTEMIEISAGVNLVPQFRTLIFDYAEFDDIGKDRLLSVGMGFSGKLSLVELPTDNKSVRLVLSLAARWTNFFIHNARNRPIDGFRYNQLFVSPQLSVQF